MTRSSTEVGALVSIPAVAIHRLIMAADSFGVRHLDSDDMSDEAEKLQKATEDMKDLVCERTLDAWDVLSEIPAWSDLPAQMQKDIHDAFVGRPICER